MQLKEQAAALAEQQFTEQLSEAQADIATLPEALKGWGSARTLPPRSSASARPSPAWGP